MSGMLRAIEVGMIKDGFRICDLCGNIIPKGTKYQMTIVSIEQARMYVNLRHIRKVLSWTELEDGKIQLDICQHCYVEIESRKEMESTKGMF